jgi:hypothetical protein
MLPPISVGCEAGCESGGRGPDDVQKVGCKIVVLCNWKVVTQQDSSKSIAVSPHSDLTWDVGSQSGGVLYTNRCTNPTFYKRASDIFLFTRKLPNASFWFLEYYFGMFPKLCVVSQGFFFWRKKITKENWCYVFKGVNLCWKNSQASLEGVEGRFPRRSEVFSSLVLLKCLEFESHTNSQQQKVTTLDLDTSTKPPTELDAKQGAWKHRLKTQ